MRPASLDRCLGFFLRATRTVDDNHHTAAVSTSPTVVMPDRDGNRVNGEWRHRRLLIAGTASDWLQWLPPSRRDAVEMAGLAVETRSLLTPPRPRFSATLIGARICWFAHAGETFAYLQRTSRPLRIRHISAANIAAFTHSTHICSTFTHLLNTRHSPLQHLLQHLFHPTHLTSTPASAPHDTPTRRSDTLPTQTPPLQTHRRRRRRRRSLPPPSPVPIRR